MSQIKVTTNHNGTLILEFPAGQFKWKGAGWSVSHPLTRASLNSLCNYVKARQYKMSKQEIMQSLTNPLVLGALVPDWDKPAVLSKPNGGATKDDFNVGDRVFHTKMGLGTIRGKKIKNVIVRFDNDNDVRRSWRCSPESLVKQ